jgi:hypothetical protein
MVSSTGSEWHAGGTRTPDRCRWEPLPAPILGRRATGVVPLRATGAVCDGPGAAEFRGFCGWHAPCGTEWHDGLSPSQRALGRTR